MVYIPIFGAFLEAVGMILEKKVLRTHNINHKNYLIYSFLAVVIVMLPFTFFFWKVLPQAKELINIIIFIAIVLISIFANILTYYSLKREDLSELEPIRLMQPLLTILLAFILSFFFAVFSQERNYSILILGLIASIALIVPHIKKNHLQWNKYILAALLGSFLFAVELVLSKFVLLYYNTFTFYFLRCLLIFIISWIFLRPHLKSIENKTKLTILITTIIWVSYRLILYYGYEKFGIVFTTIIMSILTPIFIFVLASIFLKEKIKMKHIVSSIIILACVITAVILENKQIMNAILSLF